MKSVFQKYNTPRNRGICFAFAAVAAGVAATVILSNTDSYEPVRLLSATDQGALTSDPARNPSPQNREDAFLKESVPSVGNTDSEAADPAQERAATEDELEEKRMALETVKEYYASFMAESDPVERLMFLNNVKVLVDRHPEVLQKLSMTKERFDGMFKSVQAQAGPALLEKIQKMEKYDRDKIGYVISLREVAESLTDNNRERYYESLGVSRVELQGIFCDGVAGEARHFLERALRVKAEQMTEHAYNFVYKGYLGILAQEMPDGYSRVCGNVGRDIYKEVNITDEQIKTLLDFKPEIIPAPKP